MARIAIVQKAPVFLDRDATIARAVETIAEVAAQGASLVVFPEAFIPVTRPGSGACVRAATWG
jgi:nitrilase